MKKSILVAVTLLIVLLGSVPLLGQSLLLQDDFSYTATTLLTANGWAAHSGSATNALTVLGSGLTYAGYSGSGVGNSVQIKNLGGEDDNFPFTQQSVDGTSIFVSLLVNVTDAATDKTGDYILNIGNRTAPATFTLFCGRLLVRLVSSNVNFGVENLSTSPTYGSTNFSKNTTYLLVMKYTINAAGADDVRLWVFSSGVPADEGSAGSPEHFVVTENGQDIVNAIALRQGSNVNSAECTVDGIRVGTSWDFAPLPVELSSFTAAARNGRVDLSWTTKTEVSNYGFEVERRAINNQQSTVNNWAKIAFVDGHGTTNTPQNYSYSDNSASLGKYSYRLKQIDRDGKFEYSKEVEAVVAMTPNTMVLGQNYPNPFNPETNIEFAVPVSGFTTLKVYNMLGEEVSTLMSGNVEAGVVNKVSFKGLNLASGLYFYTLRSGNFVDTKKMTLMK